MVFHSALLALRSLNHCYSFLRRSVITAFRPNEGQSCPSFFSSCLPFFAALCVWREYQTATDFSYGERWHTFVATTAVVVRGAGFGARIFGGHGVRGGHRQPRRGAQGNVPLSLRQESTRLGIYLPIDLFVYLSSMRCTYIHTFVVGCADVQAVFRQVKLFPCSRSVRHEQRSLRTTELESASFLLGAISKISLFLGPPLRGSSALPLLNDNVSVHSVS